MKGGQYTLEYLITKATKKEIDSLETSNVDWWYDDLLEEGPITLAVSVRSRKEMDKVYKLIGRK